MRFFYLFLIVSFLSHASLTEKILAQVGDEIIPLSEVMVLRRMIKKNLLPKSLLLSTVYSKSRIVNNKKRRLEFLISVNMLSQMAEKVPPLKISSKQIDKAYKKIRGKRSKKAFSKLLYSIGSSPEKFKAFLEKSLLADQSLLFFVGTKIKVSNEDIETWHKKKYGKGFFNSHIYEFVSLQMNEDEKDEMLERIKDKNSYDLKEEARSLGLKTEILKLEKEKLNSSIRKELEKLVISKTSPFFKVGSSWYLVQLLWKETSFYPKNQEKKAKIEAKVYEEKRKVQILSWLTKEKKNYPIVRN